MRVNISKHIFVFAFYLFIYSLIFVILVIVIDMVMNICSNVDVLKVIRIIKIVVFLIKVIVPIILIVGLSKDFLFAVKSGELSNEFVKAKKKIVAAIVIFLVPTFVNVIVKLVGEDNGYYDCLVNATSEGINNAYVDFAKNSLSNAKKSLSLYDYNLALDSYRNISNSSEKDSIYKELNNLKDAVDINSEIGVLLNSYSDEKYNSIYRKIDSLSNSQYKDELFSKLKDTKNKIDSQKANTNTSNSSGSFNTSVSVNNWILIGDSRFVGMSNAVGSSRLSNDNVTIIAKTSMGYDWLINTAIYEVNSILNANPDKKYHIYSNLGVNGLSNTKYASTLNELASGQWKGNIVGYISVNPYVGNSSTSVSQNQRIVNLNNDQKSKLVNVKFCDTYNGIGQSNFTSNGDLVHYDSSTYIKIYEYIINNCK